MNHRPAPPPDAASVVLTFLESIGRRSEAELYLRLFRELPKESFAIIVADSSALRHGAAALAEQLRFLRELGLVAPVAVGVLDPATASAAAERLVRRCQDMGARVVDARGTDVASRVRECLVAEQLPVLVFEEPVAAEPVGERLDRLATLAGELGTRKIVVLRRRGGLVRNAGRAGATADRRLSVVNLRADLAGLEEPRAMPPEDAALLTQVGTVLRHPACSQVSAAVTSPLDLLRELFTVRGAGTLVKRGSAIQHHADYGSVDVVRLSSLLESSFGRRVRPDFFQRPPLAVYVEESYRGAAILEPSRLAPYLTKFAVDRVAQGEGIGRDLWEALTREHPSVFWRARIENPIASWYSSLCDGMTRVGAWTVYFRGVRTADIPAIAEDALARPDDFEPREAG